MIEALNNLGIFKPADALFNDGVELYLSRNSGNLEYPFDDPTINAHYAINLGIRRRVSLAPVYPEGLSIADLKTDAEKEQYKKAFDKLIAEETLMESAGEAKAYFALMRIAKRWNDPSILADIVSAKYPDGQKQQIRGHLMDEQNWFVKYPL